MCFKVHIFSFLLSGTVISLHLFQNYLCMFTTTIHLIDVRIQCILKNLHQFHMWVRHHTVSSTYTVVIKLKASKPFKLCVSFNEENLLNLSWRIGLYVTQNINPSTRLDLGCLECKYLYLEQEVSRPLWQPSPRGSVEKAYGSNMKSLLSKHS